MITRKSPSGAGNLRGGTRGYSPLVTCGGSNPLSHLKYAQPPTLSHGISDSCEGSHSRHQRADRICSSMVLDGVDSGIATSGRRTRFCQHRGFRRTVQFFIERHEQARSKPVLTLEKPNMFDDSLLITDISRTAAGEKSRRVNIRALSSRVHSEPNHATAYKLLIGVSLFSQIHHGTILTCKWFGEQAGTWSNASIEIPSANTIDLNAVAAIRDQIKARLPQKERDLIPRITPAFLIGFTVEGTNLAVVGEQIINLPYQGRMLLTAYNDQWGILTEKSFQIVIKTWDDISIEPL